MTHAKAIEWESPSRHLRVRLVRLLSAERTVPQHGGRVERRGSETRAPSLLAPNVRPPLPVPARPALTSQGRHASIPFPTLAEAEMVKSVIQVDKPIRSPLLCRRAIWVVDRRVDPLEEGMGRVAVVDGDGEGPGHDRTDGANGAGDEGRWEASLEVTMGAVTVKQARVSLSHLLSDIELVVSAMDDLAPGKM